MDFSSSSFTQQDTTDVLQMLIEFHLKQKITIYEQAMTLRATKKLTISSFYLAFQLWQYLLSCFQRSDAKFDII